MCIFFIKILANGTLHYGEKFEDTKRIIISRKSKKNRQHKDQKKKGQNTTQKTKDRTTRTSLITGSEIGCSGRMSSSCSTCGIWIFSIDTGLLLFPCEWNPNLLIFSIDFLFVLFPVLSLCGLNTFFLLLSRSNHIAAHLTLRYQSDPW